MGTDIHVQAEKFVDGKWRRIPGYKPFGWRGYKMFAFLAGLRWDIKPIAAPRGVPDDADLDEDIYLGDHSFSWLSVQELSNFDYEQHATGTETYRGALGPEFFCDLENLRKLEAGRIVFGFDS